MTSAFDELLDALVENIERPAAAHRPAPSPAPVAATLQIQTRPMMLKAVQPAMDAAVAATRRLVESTQETAPPAACGNFKPGHGARVVGRPEPLHIIDLDPEYGRVAVRQVESNPRIAGIEWAPAPVTWMHSSSLERAPQFDMPGADEVPMAKALAAAGTRRAAAATLAENREHARRLIMQGREILSKALEAGTMTGSQVIRGEMKLNQIASDMRL